MEKSLTLAFDIERAGPTAEYDTIAIGAVVVDHHYSAVDSLFLPGYFPDETRFHPKTWAEFWSKNLETLDALRYTGSYPLSACQESMIAEFQAFRAKWETVASNMGITLALCSDNAVFDGGFINRALARHMPETPPIPYTARDPQEYAPFWETYSMQRGLLSAVDPAFVASTDWGYGDRVRQLYKIPSTIDGDIAHDHLPHHDAYTIACDFLIVRGIASGTIKRK